MQCTNAHTCYKTSMAKHCTSFWIHAEKLQIEHSRMKTGNYTYIQSVDYTADNANRNKEACDWSNSIVFRRTIKILYKTTSRSNILNLRCLKINQRKYFCFSSFSTEKRMMKWPFYEDVPHKKQHHLLNGKNGEHSLLIYFNFIVLSLFFCIAMVPSHWIIIVDIGHENIYAKVYHIKLNHRNRSHSAITYRIGPSAITLRNVYKNQTIKTC